MYLMSIKFYAHYLGRASRCITFKIISYSFYLGFRDECIGKFTYPLGWNEKCIYYCFTHVYFDLCVHR